MNARQLFRYELAYDPALIDERMSYNVRAEIRRKGALLFTTDTAHPVLTRGAGTTVNITMIKIPGKATPPGLTDIT